MKGFLILAASLLLASCDNRPHNPQVVYDDNYPQQVQTVPQEGTTVVQSDNGSSLVNGMILGHMMSGGMGRSYHSEPVSKTKTTKNVTHNYYSTPPATRPSLRQSVYSRPATPAYRPSPMRTSSSMSSRSMGRRGR